MKKILYIFTILLVSSIFAFSQNSKTEKQAMELLKKYNSDGYFIINEYIKAPSNYKFGGTSMRLSKNNNFGRYIHGSRLQDIINSLGTVVHEMNHGFTGIYALQKIDKFEFGSDYDCFFISGDEYYIVEHTETFPSKKFADEISDELRTFRFKTYISQAPKFQSTQSSGIYGLLDEFNSYYQGTKTDFLMFDYYKNETDGKPRDWQNYMSNFDGSFYAYTEFKFYILKYLIYAEKHEKELFNQILNNTSFKDAFNAVDKAFSEMISSYFDKREQILKSFEDKGHEVRLGEKFTFIDGAGTGNFMDVYNLLKNELDKSEYISMLKKLN
jgi:hypothetical protein